MKSFEGLNLLIFIGGWEKYDQYLGTFYKVVRTSLKYSDTEFDRMDLIITKTTILRHVVTF